jgi:hypothetical protein
LGIRRGQVWEATIRFNYSSAGDEVQSYSVWQRASKPGQRSVLNIARRGEMSTPKVKQPVSTAYSVCTRMFDKNFCNCMCLPQEFAR